MTRPIQRRSLLSGFLALLVAAAIIAPALAQLQSFGRTEATIVTAAGKQVFKLEIAQTPEQMAQGLMFRKSLAVDAGMIFDYGTPRDAAFWMKNTLIPLDMLFVGADGRIVNIHERAVPGSLDPIPSAAPVRAVIEINGGLSAKLGIKPGDRVLHPIFGTGG